MKVLLDRIGELWVDGGFGTWDNSWKPIDQCLDYLQWVAVRFLPVLAQRSAICGIDLCPARHPPQRLLQVTRNLLKVIDEVCNRTGRQRVPLSWPVTENVLCCCMKIIDAMNGRQTHVPYWRPRRKKRSVVCRFLSLFICWSIGFEFWGSYFSAVGNSGPTLVYIYIYIFLCIYFSACYILYIFVFLIYIYGNPLLRNSFFVFFSGIYDELCIFWYCFLGIDFRIFLVEGIMGVLIYKKGNND